MRLSGEFNWRMVSTGPSEEYRADLGRVHLRVRRYRIAVDLQDPSERRNYPATKSTRLADLWCWDAYRGSGHDLNEHIVSSPAARRVVCVADSELEAMVRAEQAALAAWFRLVEN